MLPPIYLISSLFLLIAKLTVTMDSSDVRMPSSTFRQSRGTLSPGRNSAIDRQTLTLIERHIRSTAIIVQFFLAVPEADPVRAFYSARVFSRARSSSTWPNKHQQQQWQRPPRNTLRLSHQSAIEKASENILRSQGCEHCYQQKKTPTDGNKCGTY